ncbi:hypothetical protein MMAG44476_34359 [Mycolicibacterium mageritense DSM 44476 = CIP 104973]|uniref:Pentapeptide repeat-containing protein n=1 Tax=Mycolicibacterium mageritense TaxID=53462 RepID=A0ABN5YJ23_MYCME|nr:pentapeptide repeat-containing protein [Mycolicibacterium mageritense]BBX38043.1 hypothetical protein MMAGJ_73250 [Mycolicibacterium mageritense]CDO27221.1 Pentapeptide repeats (8 copies) [Mycolicibacterium mageritense DSM 44476 = CIP 104973]
MAVFFRVLAIALGVAAASVVLWRVSASCGPFIGLLAVSPWFVAWVVSEVIREDRRSAPEHPAMNVAGAKHVGLRTWFRISIWISVVATGLAITLVISMLHWEWVTTRIGGALAPTVTVVVAAIGSAGAARTVLAQADNAERIRIDDDEELLWKRFESGAKQLADDHFAIMAAGVYSLANLADDWIRHYQRLRGIGVTNRVEDTESATIVELLCAHLRRRADRKDGLSEPDRLEAELVNEAIIGQFQTHLRMSTSDNEEDGMWVGRFTVDLRYTDLSENNWPQIDLRHAMLRGADLYSADLSSADISHANLGRSDLRGADLSGATYDDETNFDLAICDDATKWPDPDFQVVGLSAAVSFTVNQTEILGCTVLRRAGRPDRPVWRVPTGLPHRQERPATMSDTATPTSTDPVAPAALSQQNARASLLIWTSTER